MIKTEREIWPSLPSHYVLIRLSHLPQVGPAALQILNGLFGLPHEVLGLTRVSTLQYTDTTPREVYKSRKLNGHIWNIGVFCPCCALD